MRLDGLPGAQVLTPPLTLKAEETRTIPLIIRLREDDVADRTVPFVVIVSSPTAELQIPTTFKTGAVMGGPA